MTETAVATEEALAAGGAIARLIEGFQPRSDQQAMAVAVAEALAEGHSLACEAGTGTGKTFAYLVPALLSGQRTVISTGTRHLQDQLFHRDLPLVRRALQVPVEVALLKGRANYLCKYRLDQARQGAEASQARLFNVAEWALGTHDGDLADCPDLPEDDPLRGAVTSTTENCLGQDCPDYEQCYVLKARRRAAAAELVVVNHHLLLADMALRESGFGELLPAVDAIIFDEAHQLPALAAEFFSEGLSSRQLLGLARDCREAQSREAGDMTDIRELTTVLERAVQQTRLAFGNRDRRTDWQEWARDSRVEAALEQLAQALADLDAVLDTAAERGRLLAQVRRRCGLQVQRLDSFRDHASEQWVRWVETAGQHFNLHRTPIDVSETFQARLGGYGCNAIYTSATLAVAGDFSHFTGQLGLGDAVTRHWPGPFDYENQALLYLPAGMPDPNTSDYTAAVVEAARPVLAASGGRAFLLFTSHRALQEAARLLKDRIGFPLLVQGDAPRGQLLDRFRAEGNAVLLGTSSFWEGVDVRGEALTCVIIDKLPFPPPDDPIYAARAGRMKAEGIDPFMHYALPQMIITLKQGMGRLIRDQNDYGVLMLCDPRLRSRGYGKRVLAALPPMPQTRDVNEVEQFFQLRRQSV